MGRIYKTSGGWSQELVGECDGGRIYKTSGGWSRELVGEYDNGRIYKTSGGWSRELVGEYDNGRIYKTSGGWSRELIGEYDGGRIYKTSGGWSRELVGECDDFAGSAALLLIFEQQTNLISTRENSVSSPKTPEASGVGCSGALLLQGLGVLIGIFLAGYISYTMYNIFFKGNGTWAYYAMFLTAVCSTVATNIYARISYLKSPNKQEYSKNILGNGLCFFCVLNVVISYIIYTVEMVVTGNFSLWNMLLGILVSIVNIAVFALPFIVVEFLILLIIKLCTRNR